MPRSSAGAWANSSPVNQFPGRGAASSNNWAMRGMDCRELSAGMPHLERETSLDDVLATLELLARRFREELERGRSARVTELVVDGVRVAIMPTAPTRAERTLDSRQSSSSFPPEGSTKDAYGVPGTPSTRLLFAGHRRRRILSLSTASVTA